MNTPGYSSALRGLGKPVAGSREALMSDSVIALLIFAGLFLVLMFALAKQGGRVRLISLMRVPILFAALAVALPILAITSRSEMLDNLFTLERGTDLFAVALLAMLNAWLLGLAWLMAWEYGPERIGETARSLPGFWGERRLLRLMPFTLIAAPLIVVVYQRAEGVGRVWPLIAAGVAAGAVFLTLAGVRKMLLVSSDSGDGSLAGRLLWSRVPVSISAGYYDAMEHRTYPGHGTATAFVTMLLLAYLFGESYLDPRLASDPPLPALAYLLALSMLLGAVLSGAAFFFDRYRVPLLLVIGAWYIASYAAPATDHTFVIHPAEPAGAVVPTVADTVNAWLERREDITVSSGVRNDESETTTAGLRPPLAVSDADKPPVIIVCASGGGIQASAWTTRVLTWLVESLEAERPGLGAEFAGSVRLVSSTSGGSVGSLFFWEAYRRRGGALATDAKLLAAIRAAGSRSSLAETGWGVVFPDFQRAFFPFGVDPRIDRAWAAEQVWRRGFDPERPVDARLSDWAAAAAAGRMPAVVMNSFAIETGDRVLLSTVEIRDVRRARTFARLYGVPPVLTPYDSDARPPLTADLDMVTAARLSATFPYVSPASRAAWDKERPSQEPPPQIHLADGGYFDNFGVLAAVEWARDLLSTPPADAPDSAAELLEEPLPERIGPIVLIEIRAFGEAELEGDAERETGREYVAGRIARCGTRREEWGDRDTVRGPGWRQALLGPVEGLLKMRSSTQVARNDTEICLLRELHGERIVHLIFQPKAGEWPFSWHMTRAQIEQLDAHREAVQASPARERLAELLR
jgi:hypothetical protein